jgi:hypothetical protein
MTTPASPYITRGDVAYDGDEQFQVVAVDRQSGTAVLEQWSTGKEFEVRRDAFTALGNGDLRVDTYDAVPVAS